MKSTKIVATIGPASDSVETLRKMHENGMNVARLNFSHGSHEYFTEIINRIREVSDEITIMVDTKGPEIRTGDVNEPIVLKAGDEIRIGNKCTAKNCVQIGYEKIHMIEIGHKLLVDDGMLAFEVISKDENGLKVKTLVGGVLSSRKTVTVQGHNVEVDFMSEKDRADLDFAVEHDCDLIAASFVRTVEDVRQIQQVLDEHDSKIKIISKIEHWKTVDNYKEILKESLGLMVARGDLGVEIAMEQVPGIQSMIIKHCNELGKPVIVATQMLESMRESPRPTRAEVSDVAQAIRQGADSVMLSGETASGKYPVEAVQMMTRIAKEYDERVYFRKLEEFSPEDPRKEIALYVTRAAYKATRRFPTKVIITPTASGYTARKVARFRPEPLIIAVVKDMTVFRQLQITWGVKPYIRTQQYENPDVMVFDLIQHFYEEGVLSTEDRVVITAGYKQEQGFTNLLEIYDVKDIIKNQST